MRILLESTELAGGGREAPSGLRVNGAQVVEEAQLFRALTAQLWPRGNASTSVEWLVAWQFGSLREAEVFLLTHFAGLPKSGRATFECGTYGDTQDVYLEDAVLEAAVAAYTGLSVTVRYILRGGLPTTDALDPLPTPDPEEGDAIVLRRGRVAIGNGETSVTVTFSAPLASTPVVHVDLEVPAGSPVISVSLVKDSPSTTGFTARLGAATPNANYRLNYVAIQ